MENDQLQSPNFKNAGITERTRFIALLKGPRESLDYLARVLIRLPIRVFRFGDDYYLESASFLDAVDYWAAKDAARVEIGILVGAVKFLSGSYHSESVTLSRIVPLTDEGVREKAGYLDKEVVHLLIGYMMTVDWDIVERNMVDAVATANVQAALTYFGRAERMLDLRLTLEALFETTNVGRWLEILKSDLGIFRISDQEAIWFNWSLHEAGEQSIHDPRLKSPDWSLCGSNCNGPMPFHEAHQFVMRILELAIRNRAWGSHPVSPTTKELKIGMDSTTYKALSDRASVAQARLHDWALAILRREVGL